MTSLDALRRLSAAQSRERLLALGAAASVAWLALAGLFALLAPESESGGTTAWAIWLVGLLLPLALIWLAVWSARGLMALRAEADDLRAMLARLQDQAPLGEMPAELPTRADHAPAPASRRPAAAPTPAPAPQPRAPADSRQALLAFDSPAATEMTGSELFYALNFPDGPEDREAIRCLRLALADPVMARLIRAAQDVVTLLAGQGVYMDELQVPETDAALWRRFAQGARGAPVAGLAVIRDQVALDMAAGMLRGDEVFRDVAHHFLRHFDRLLSRKAEEGDPQLLAVLAETRSGRAFILLAQATGMLGQDAPAEVTG